MEPWLEALVARSRANGGVLTFDEVGAAVPNSADPYELTAIVTAVLDRLVDEGISLVDPNEPDKPPPDWYFWWD
jgi:hypothetical protein